MCFASWTAVDYLRSRIWHASIWRPAHTGARQILRRQPLHRRALLRRVFSAPPSSKRCMLSPRYLITTHCNKGELEGS